MARKKKEGSRKSYKEWMAEQGHHPYPNDLPFPRQMQYGPHTPEVARRYLDADYPLPGSFPEAEPREENIPAWIEYLENEETYPGTKLDKAAAAARDALVHDFAASDYGDPAIAKEILKFDSKTGYSPIFAFQYAVLNFKKWSSILIFELNGVGHILHWHDQIGWHIDKHPISKDPFEARDNFVLFELIANSLNHPEHYYPVIIIRKKLFGDPRRILEDIPEGLPSKRILGRFGVRRNPDLEYHLAILEEDYWHAPPHARKKDLSKINALRKKLNLPPVNVNLEPVVEKPEEDIEENLEPKEPEDEHTEARELYQQYIAKRNMMQPHRDYCRRMIRATASRNGQTPVMPLAIMGTNGGPLLCDTCEKQFPLEGGKWNRVLAGEAWKRNANANANWYSFISGHVTFLEEANGTFRAYHGYIDKGCGGIASQKDEFNRKKWSETRPTFKSRYHKLLRSFLLEKKGIEDLEERKAIIKDLQSELFGYDPGIGVNRP